MGDLAERHFIESKSDIDPTNKEGAAKVAKFILGAANRDPERAKKYLEGQAVMILGVGENNVGGLERFEAKDLVGAVQPYVGDPGPRWDFQRIRVDDDRDVIVVGRAAALTSPSEAGGDRAMPQWFADFLIDRATRKPSAHTIKAYRQDFAAVAILLTAGGPAEVALPDITKDNMRAAFAGYAATHEPASIRRCWSTWNVLCDFLYTAELIPANPMPFVGRPKAAKTLPR